MTLQQACTGVRGAIAVTFVEDKIHALYRQQEVNEAVELANKSPLKPPRLGEFTIARLREDYDGAGYVQIRAAQRHDPNGLEFRYHLRAVGDIEIDAESCAKNLLEAAKQFDRTIEQVPSASLRAAIDAAIEPAKQLHTPMRVISIGLCPSATPGHHAITIDLETLGDDLTTETARIMAWDLIEARQELARLADRHARRDATRCRAVAQDAIGWINGLAVRTLKSSGYPLDDAIRHLQATPRVEFDFRRPDGREFSASFYWEEGVIQSDLQSLDSEWSCSSDCLSIKHPQHPEAMITAWVGRRIGEIFEQDFIPPDTIIVSVSEAPGGWLDLGLTIAPELIGRLADCSGIVANSA